MQITLQNGARAILGQKTAALFFTDHIEIREGVGQVSGKQGFQLEALAFSASPTTEQSTARVAIERPGRILVTAVDTSVKVTKDGVLLAEVPAGITYFFEENSVPGSGVAPPAAKRAGTAGGNGAGTRGKAWRLSTGARWGIAAGGAGAATAIGVYVSHNDASSNYASRYTAFVGACGLRGPYQEQAMHRHSMSLVFIRRECAGPGVGETRSGSRRPHFRVRRSPARPDRLQRAEASEILSDRSPIIETYIQEWADAAGASEPVRDHYFGPDGPWNAVRFVWRDDRRNPKPSYKPGQNSGFWLSSGRSLR